MPEKTLKHQEKKDEEDKEIGHEVERLVEKLGQSFEQYSFSMKYKDTQLEKEFQKEQHQKMIIFGKILVLEVLAVCLISWGFQLYNKLTKPNYNRFIGHTIAAVLTQASVSLHYILSRKQLTISLWFANIQTILYVAGALELGIQGNSSQANTDIFATLLALTTMFSFVSYDQSYLFFSYLIAWIYMNVRTYFWYQEDHFRWLRFNLYNLAAFASIYILSRAFQNRERLKFKQQKNQTQLLAMFHNLIKLYHDGIIITSEEQIIFKNKQAGQIFQTDQKSNFDQQQDILIAQSQFHNAPSSDQILINAIKQAKPKVSRIQEQQIQQSMLINMWDFIIRNQQQEEQFIFEEQIQDGMYFKYKQGTTNNDSDSFQNKAKKLQVFNKALHIGSKTFMMTTVRDMSHWLELEKQRNLSQMKTIAFASAAHEFRNPLNGINSSLELLKDLIDQNRGHNFYQTAKNCSNLMLFLVNDILDFSQIESKTLVLNQGIVNIKDLLEQCIDILHFKANSKGIDLYYYLDVLFPQFIYTDGQRLKQVLINLVSNSIKYTQVGHVRIVGTLRHGMYCFTVEDTGVGIDSDKIGVLFTAFTKIQKNRDLNKQGVGLGLTISRNLVVSMGGEIEVESELNVGSKFHILFPIRQNKQDISLGLTENIGQNMSIDCNYTEITDLEQDGGSSKERRALTDILDLHFTQPLTNRLLLSSANMQGESTKQIEQPNHATPYQGYNFEEYFANQYNSQNQVVNNELESHNEARGANSNNYLDQCQCPKVIIVDDEPFNLIALGGQLAQLNILNIDQAFNGKDCLDMVRNNWRKCSDGTCNNHQPYKLIITDNQMPIMSGTETTKIIKDMQLQGEANQDMKIILISGDQIKEKYLFDEALLKPFSSTVLKQIIQKYNLT